MVIALGPFTFATVEIPLTVKFIAQCVIYSVAIFEFKIINVVSALGSAVVKISRARRYYRLLPA